MFFFGLDLLYAQPQVDGVPFAIEGSDIKNPTMPWGLGFRLAFGTRPIAIRWTCLPIQNTTHASGHLVPVWSSAPQSADSFVDTAKAHWRLHLGIVDFEWRKKLDLSSHFSLKPRVGIRFASIRQKFYVAYQGGTLFPGNEDHFHAKNKYWGLGPEVGIDTKWSVGLGWSVTGSITFAALSGAFYIHETEKEKPSHITYLKFFNLYNMATAIWDFALGVQWKRGDTALDLSWEEHLFPGQNRLNSPPINRLLNIGTTVAVSAVSLGFRVQF